MEFSAVTIRHIDLVNSVLEDIGVPKVLDNPNFAPYWEGSGHHRLIVNVAPGDPRAPFTLFLESDGIRLDVCGIDESFEWSTQQISSSPEDIKEFVKAMFTSYMLVESCGPGNLKSRIYLFNKQGILIQKHALRGVVQKFSGWDCKKLLFMPLY